MLVQPLFKRLSIIYEIIGFLFIVIKALGFFSPIVPSLVPLPPQSIRTDISLR